MNTQIERLNRKIDNIDAELQDCKDRLRGKWNHVKDRLPPEQGIYIVQLRERFKVTMAHFITKDEWMMNWERLDVEYWQELPEPNYELS